MKIWKFSRGSQTKRGKPFRAFLTLYSLKFLNESAGSTTGMSSLQCDFLLKINILASAIEFADARVLQILISDKAIVKTFKKGLDYGFIRYEYLQDTGISEFDGRCKDIDLEKKFIGGRTFLSSNRLTRSEISKRYGVDFSERVFPFGLESLSKISRIPHARDTHSWMISLSL